MLTLRSFCFLGVICSLLAFLGCGSDEPEAILVPQTYNNMKTLGSAYISATQKNGKPPTKLSDLRPFVAEGIDLEQISRSENDGEDFVIVWGIDFQTSQNEKGVYPIVIYEKKGKNGIRFICQFNDVMEIDETNFRASYFPPGHTPEP